MLESVEMARRQVVYPTTTEQLWSILDAIEREVEERYVELPKDMNGEQVYIGDTVHDHEEGYDFRVDGFMLWGNTSEWWAFQDQAAQQKLENCSIVKPPTVKNVLREFFDEYDSVSGYAPDENEVLAKFAEKLQLKEAE